MTVSLLLFAAKESRVSSLYRSRISLPLSFSFVLLSFLSLFLSFSFDFHLFPLRRFYMSLYNPFLSLSLSLNASVPLDLSLSVAIRLCLSLYCLCMSLYVSIQPPFSFPLSPCPCFSRSVYICRNMSLSVAIRRCLSLYVSIAAVRSTRILPIL